MGTVQYMSPEQARTPSVDHRSDQFTLGLILFEMATGERRFRRDSVGHPGRHHVRGARILAELNPEVPASLQVIATCLAEGPGGSLRQHG